MSNSLPELNLLRYFLGGDLRCRCAIDDKRPFPLRPRNEDRTYAPLWRKVFLYVINMGFLPRKRNARPRINAELNHLKTVIEKELTKVGRPFPLLSGAHRQIEGNYKPAHFEFFGVHGL